MLDAMVASRLTRIFSSRATTTGFIKFASKGAIPRAIHFVFRERALAVAGGLRARSFPRSKSGNGLVICCGAWIAGAKAVGGPSCAAADSARARAFRWDNHSGGSCGPNQPAASLSKNCRSGDPVWIWFVPPFSVAASQLGWHASRLRRFNALVLYHGIGARRGFDACPILSGIGGCAGRASPRFARTGIRKFQRAFSALRVGRSTHIGISHSDNAGRDYGLRKTWGGDTAPRLVQHRFGVDGCAHDHRLIYPLPLIRAPHVVG